MPKHAQRGRVVPHQERRTPRIPAPIPLAVPRESTDHLSPTFSFKHVDTAHYPLHSWQKTELAQLMDRLQYMERQTWRQITATGGQGANSGGFGYKPLQKKGLRCAIPTHLEHVDLCEFRVSQKMRVMGYRDDTVFCFVWFDRGHGVTGS